MLTTARKSEPILFNQAKLNLLEIDNTKAIIGCSLAVHCGLPTVGFKRFYEAKTAGTSADLVVTIPRIYNQFAVSQLVEVERFDRDEKGIFRVVQVQERFDSAPPCFQLTLAEEKVLYVDKR